MRLSAPPITNGPRALVRKALPNMRFKLAGGDRSKGNGVLCPSGHGLSSTPLAPASRSPAA